ncbi:hypothetical protein RLW55_03385 [Hyphomicrobium sp. B1]|uniref:hypothetical protein n=1 Tax=Hyphomicrobium sp. B1 TaxID=3075651 RepID=UPI003C2F9F3B
MPNITPAFSAHAIAMRRDLADQARQIQIETKRVITPHSQRKKPGYVPRGGERADAVLVSHKRAY